MAITYDKAPGSRPGTSQNITTGSSPTQTTAFGAQTYQVRVATGAASAFIKIGDNPTAASTGDSMEIGANVVDYFIVTPGQKASVVQGSASGAITFTEMS